MQLNQMQSISHSLRNIENYGLEDHKFDKTKDYSSFMMEQKN